MASENEASCDADPNFAVICSFLERFGTSCGLQAVDFVELQSMLENTQEVSPVLIDLHIKLMRKLRKSINNDRWERGIVKFCHTFSNQDAWEIERFGYKKARLSAKLRLLKELLEMQFDNNTSFKNKIKEITAKELRSQPLGRDKLGNSYWYQADDNCQIRVYKEDPDEETWALVAKDRQGLVTLISKLTDNQDSSSTDAVTNDDSNSLEENKPVVDTGQQDSSSSNKSSDDQGPPILKQEADDEDTKMDEVNTTSTDVKLISESVPPVLTMEEKKPELSGIKEKYIRSDNFIQSNRKAVESAGFVDISNADLKRPIDDDIDEPSIIKRPRTDRPTLLGNKKKPYFKQNFNDEDEVEDEELGEEEEDVEEEEEEEDEEQTGDEDEDEDDDSHNENDKVSEAIEEPLMLVIGRGSGQDNQCGNAIVEDEIVEEVMYFYGEGNGRDCDTGNEEKKETANDEAGSSIKSPAKNNIKLGTIIDTKTDHLMEKPLPKTSPSRWDVGKPDVDSNSVHNLVGKFESISKTDEAPVLKKPTFFFGPMSGFTFKAPSMVTSTTMSFGTSQTNSTPAKCNSVPKEDELLPGKEHNDTVNEIATNDNSKDDNVNQTKSVEGDMTNNEPETIPEAFVLSKEVVSEGETNCNLTPSNNSDNKVGSVSELKEIKQLEVSEGNDLNLNDVGKTDSFCENDDVSSITDESSKYEVETKLTDNNKSIIQQSNEIELPTTSKNVDSENVIGGDVVAIDCPKSSEQTFCDSAEPSSISINEDTITPNPSEKDETQSTVKQNAGKVSKSYESASSIAQELQDLLDKSDSQITKDATKKPVTQSVTEEVTSNKLNHDESSTVQGRVEVTAKASPIHETPGSSSVDNNIIQTVSDDNLFSRNIDVKACDNVVKEESSIEVPTLTESPKIDACTIGNTSLETCTIPKSRQKVCETMQVQQPVDSLVESDERGSILKKDVETQEQSANEVTPINPLDEQCNISSNQTSSEVPLNDVTKDIVPQVVQEDQVLLSGEIERGKLIDRIERDDDKEKLSESEMVSSAAADCHESTETANADADNTAIKAEDKQEVSELTEDLEPETITTDKETAPQSEISSIQPTELCEVPPKTLECEKVQDNLLQLTKEVESPKPELVAETVNDSAIKQGNEDEKSNDLLEVVPIPADILQTSGSTVECSTKPKEDESSIISDNIVQEPIKSEEKLVSAENAENLKEIAAITEVPNKIPIEETVSLNEQNSKTVPVIDMPACSDRVQNEMPPVLVPLVHEIPLASVSWSNSESMYAGNKITEAPSTLIAPPAVVPENSPLVLSPLPPKIYVLDAPTHSVEAANVDLKPINFHQGPPAYVHENAMPSHVTSNFIQLQPLQHKPLYNDDYGKMNLTQSKSYESQIIGETSALEEPPHLTPLDCVGKEPSILSYQHAVDPPKLAPEDYSTYTVAHDLSGGIDKSYVPEPSKEDTADSLEEEPIIQEIGSISQTETKRPNLHEAMPTLERQIVPANEEEDIVKIRGNAHSKLEINVDKPPKDIKFAEVPCTKQKVALLGDDDANDDAFSDDMNYDDNNSEPMDLEECAEGEIIQRSETDTKPDKVSEEDKSKDGTEKKVQSLQSLSLDFTGETPSLDQVHALVKSARKRGLEEEAAEEVSDEEAGGKRRKMRGKRSVNRSIRRSIEQSKNKDMSSSDEEKKEKHSEEAASKPEKKRPKRKKLMMGLEIPEDGVVLDAPTGLRQSRRIAQQKIKEEAERRKLEEIALEEMKSNQKKKSKKDEDKDYKAEKRKLNKILTEDETTNEGDVDDKKEKKKKKRKHRKFDELNPWRSSSDSSSEDSHVEEEEEEEEENYIETVKSDHEFSPESDLENTQDPQPLKRARTVRKEDEDEPEEAADDTNCQKCQKSDHPEWILLCDGCDSGWHCSCLRPALLVIPEGDWYCPPCQHTRLVKLLQDKLVEFDKVQTKREMELRRKERLAYVGISLANVLPEREVDDGTKTKRDRPKKREPASGNESESSASSKSGSESGSDSQSSSESGSSSTDSDEPIYKLRQRRQAHSYRFKDYDELINSAIQEEVEVKQQSESYSKGKDMATIVQAEAQENQEAPLKEEGAESEEDIIRPTKKILGKKKHRRLNSLDISSEEDADSDEDFKGSTSEYEEDEEDEFNDSGSSSSSYIGRKKGRGSIRRSTRARISRYDRDFINDDSEDSDEPQTKRSRSDWEESDESEEESDSSWARKKKRRGGAARKPSSRNSSTSKRKKSKKNHDSDRENIRRKKTKIKFGSFDDDDVGGRRRTRGKKINYIDALATDSEEESRRRRQAKDEESEDEFVLNEEEDDVQDEEGREEGSSDDSNITGLVPGVKKGSKKGKGKGGIKRIKRAQGEEEEALFPPLPDASSAPVTSEAEPNPIEQINKNLEAMDEKEIGMMMEEEEYANKQLQMVAAQLEKEKRRKELEAARKLEMNLQPPIVSPQSEMNQPSVIQAIPLSVASQIPPPTLMRQIPTEPAQPILQDVHSMHQQPPLQIQQPPQLSESPGHIQQSPHSLILPPQMGPVAMMIDTMTPKKRGRKPKTQITPPEVMPGPPFVMTSPSADRDDSSDASLGFNADGTPKKRRGRGKGKKTLEKEAAAAAAAATSQPTAKPTESKEIEPIAPPIDLKATLPAEIPLVGGKLGVASAPQPFSQSQPKPSVITRMLQAQPGQPAYPVGGISHNFTERSQGPPLNQSPFVSAPGAIPPRGLLPGAFRTASNHYAVIRSGAPPIRPQGIPSHLYHHPMDSPPTANPAAERSSPSLTSPSSASPISNKSDPTPPPPPYAVRPPIVRFPQAAGVPTGMPPRHPTMLPQMHARPPYSGVPPHNFHYAPPYGEGGSQFQHVPPPYQEQFAGEADGPKTYDEENGEFGGLVSYFSSQREDDLDT